MTQGSKTRPDRHAPPRPETLATSADQALRLAAKHERQLLAAVREGERSMFLPPSGLGFALVGPGSGTPHAPGTVLVYDRPALWAVTARIGVEVLASGTPDFVPCLVLQHGTAMLCWLGPFYPAGAGRMAS